MAAIAVLGVVGLVAYVSFLADDGGVELRAHPEGSTDRISFAGMFPAEGGDPLANPRSIAISDGTVYIAEADAGRISVYSDNGRRLGEVADPLIRYPVDLAFFDGALYVVDTSEMAVVRLDLDSTFTVENARVLAGFSPALERPTAVAAGDGVLYVADSARGVIVAVDADGELVGAPLGTSIEPPLTSVTGLEYAAGLLYASDSNAGRVVTIDAATGNPGTFIDRSFRLPRGLVLDGAEGLFVVDVFDSSVTRYDELTSGGVLTDDVGEYLPEGAGFVRPENAAWMSASGRLYVADAGDGTVKIFNVTEVSEP